MENDLEHAQAVHDYGDFRNNYAKDAEGQEADQRLTGSDVRFGQHVQPLIDTHPVIGRKFLNFNEAFVTHITGMTTNESTALRVFLADQMNEPEDQLRWRWRSGDIAMWGNRVTAHCAVADDMPSYRCNESHHYCQRSTRPIMVANTYRSTYRTSAPCRRP